MIPGLPYDAEIKYLRSTGTQWIDLGIYGTGNMQAEVTYKAVSNTKTGSSRVFGARETKDSRAFFVAAFSSGKNTSGGYIYWNYGQQSSTGLNLMLADFDKHTVSVGQEVKADGKLLKTFTKETFTTPYTLKLFTAEYSSGFGDLKFVGYIYDFKLFDGDELILDFIPVRVGQTGYMYDRVSKRLFGNSGTGSFVLGPDVAKPVIGLYGMRISKSIDYTRNGLVALYDGIDNAGYNKHDSNATVWKDLTDNHYDLTSNGTPSWRYNGAYINIKANSFWRSSIPQFRTLWESQNGLFIECICQLGVRFLFSYGGSVPTVESFAAEIKNVNSYRKFFSFISPITTPYFDWPDNTVGRVWAWANQSIYSVGMNSQSGSGTYTYQQKEKYGFGIGCRGDNYGTSSANNTIVFRLAVYDHMLTETEIAHNYAIDKERFNLP